MRYLYELFAHIADGEAGTAYNLPRRRSSG